MKTLTHFITLIFVFFLLTSSSCKKEDDLTKPTQEGKNTFSCKINGQVYIPNGGGLLSPVKAISASVVRKNNGTNELSIFTTKSESELLEKIYINIGDISTTGTYNMGIDNTKYCEYYKRISTSTTLDEKQYSTRNNNNGSVNITRYDLTNGIVSGTFSFKATNDKNVNDIVTVTDGRFDVTLN